jgi:acyl-CoA dehydrogenase
MNFDFSDEQKQLGLTARRLLDDLGGVARARAVAEGNSNYDIEMWNTIAALGFQGAAIADEFGGLGLGYLELCVMAEEFGRVLAPVPFNSSIYLFSEAVKCAAQKSQKQKYLPGIASGTIIGALATPACGLVNVSNTGELSGTVMPVADGLAADFAVVFAADKEKSCFLVDLKDPGVTRTEVETIDPSRKHARLEFSGVTAETLCKGRETVKALSDVLDRAAVLLSFEQIGGAERVLEIACDYARSRFAFGRLIGSFQAIKHNLADMYVSLTLARSNAYYAAWALSTGAPDLPIAAAAARVSATQAFQHCATECIQVHGGVGFTWEFDCHLYFRRANALALAIGSKTSWEEKLIDRMRVSRLREMAT